MFGKILIANRGEIACRIARTCRRLGVAVAGVHSSADRDALHVRVIGESIEVGAPAAAESYLHIEAVLDAARRTGAEAVHPGYGFLAENASFAQAVEAAGLVFIGPTPEILLRLGDKAAAKREAKAAGVPVLEGSPSPSEDPSGIARIVRSLEPPVMLKAAAGGGGKGMRSILTLAGLEDQIESAMREAGKAFGYPALIVEQLIEHGRHVEVQIAGDGSGRVIHLFERECSLQRRHQKIIEEAPAANLPARLRDRLTADAVRLAERLCYRSVGTVEFLLQGDEYWFLEVNPRLQVEHPVTEMVTGIDIVELMLRIAAGESLPLRQEDIHIEGHAVEARICAEDPAAGFLPSTGRLACVEFPGDGVRVETGVEAGMQVTPFYDPMLAKLITHARTRDQALDRLAAALDETALFGVTTNKDFLCRLIDLPETRAATFHTRLIDEQIEQWALKSAAPDAGTIAVAAYFWMYRQRGDARNGPWSAWDATGWRMAAGGDGVALIPSLHIEAGGYSAEIRFAPLRPDASMLVRVNDAKLRVALRPLGDGRFVASVDSRHEAVRLVAQEDMLYVHDRKGAHALRAVPYLAHVGAGMQASGELRAPMMGLVLKVNVAAGDCVKAGDVVAVLESMKMEMRIASDCDGIVMAVNCAAGQSVERNAVMVVVQPGPKQS